jgi:hypothetical protein
LNITLKFTTSFHPMTDGQVERKNKDIGEALRCLVNVSQSNWLDSLPFVQFALNASINSTTGYAPFYLLYGFAPTSLPSQLAVDETYNPAADRFLSEQQAARQSAADTIRTAKWRQTSKANKSRGPTPTFQPGDKVMLSAENIRVKNGGAAKLRSKWLGPFKVVDQKGVTVKLSLPVGWRIFDRFHVSLLKPYHGQ